MLSTLKVSPETLKRLRIRKAHNNYKTFDQVINIALDNSTNQNKGQ